MTHQTIQERFLRYHAEHPEVYKGICMLARKAAARGHRQFGIARIWEVLRWTTLAKYSELRNGYFSPKQLQ